MLTILHLADLHLGWTPFFLPPEKGAAWQRLRDGVLQRAVEYALTHGIHLVVVAGDLFDRHDPAPDVLEGAQQQLRRLEEAGVRVVTVPGAHDDMSYPRSGLRLQAEHWPGVLVRNGEPERVLTVEVDGTPVHLYSAACVQAGRRSASPAPPVFPRSEDPGIHVGIFHGRLEESDGPSSVPLLDAEALAAPGYEYVALGGAHEPGSRQLGKSVLTHAGLVESLGFDEPGCASWTIARIEPGRVALETVPVEVCPVVAQEIRVRWRAEGELRREMEALANPSALARFVLKGASQTALDVGRLAARLRDRFFHVEVLDDTQPLPEALIARAGKEPTIRGCLLERLRARRAAAANDRERAVLESALRAGLLALEAEAGR